MNEYFGQIQEGVQRLLPIVLLGPGILFVAAGLMIWLGGLRWLRGIAAFTAAMAGLAGAWVLTGGQIIPMVLCPVILAGIGMFLNRMVVVLLGAGLVAGAILIGPSLGEIGTQITRQGKVSWSGKDSLNLLESVDQVQQLTEQAKQTVREVVKHLPSARKSTAFIVAATFAAMGLFSWRHVCALTCSAIGTAEIFTGMTILLLYKGAAALQLLSDNRQMLIIAAIGMVVMGTALQLWLCPAKRKKKDMAKELLKEENQK